jgi:protein associated with RNAse G/E
MKTSEAVRRIKVQKKNPAGEVTYEYEGLLLQQDQRSIVLQALFDRDDMPFLDVVFKTGDRFIEYYYTDRWYNIFAIHDREDDRVKGWYCNIGEPAVFEDSTVSYIDLALDLWVSTSGKQTVLDQDEFEALELSEELRTGALKGLEELKQLFLNNTPPT